MIIVWIEFYTKKVLDLFIVFLKRQLFKMITIYA